ncbi:glutamate receptor 3.7-like [Tasmannia lanceolata]|uniref:glutamate receptor 3.7-like n=1 Tax=Tasmannia lanceolata TaxID=3420 RepID=UPI004062BB2A
MGHVLVSLLLLILGIISCIDCERPQVVNIGAIFTFDSVIGRVAKVAIETAVADINANSNVLGGTKLRLIAQDSNCSVFTGSIAAFQLLEEGAVAIIGPQSSAVAHMMSFIANGLQVPLVSFAATDSTLSALQIPYFFRTTPSDSYQMAAMADLISYYEWRQVIAIFVDDDYGRNGISLLGDLLAKKMYKISYKIALPVQASHNQIMNLLDKSKLIGPRVYVVHASPDSGLKIFPIAQHLQMMTYEYVWLTTDWLCAALDSSKPLGPTSLNFLQGVIGFRQLNPQSDQKKAFVSRWREFHRKGIVNFELNSYGLYAYDTVWVIAHAINEFLNDSGNISFSSSNKLHDMEGTELQLGKLRVFDGGKLLLEKLQQTNFTGLTGPIQFDSDRNLVNGAYEVINVGHSVIRRIGYWSSYSGLSVSLPEILFGNTERNTSLNQQLNTATWPGGKGEKPRGWVIVDNERPLRIGVPKRASFVEFVTETNDTHLIEGYCIDVFNAALKLVPYAVPYEFVPFGDGQVNPSYDELVYKVAENVFDAAVGDISIVPNRTRIVDFTQPYLSTGLVIVIPITSKKSSAWVFLKPFSVEMWCVTGAFFFFVGVVIWILEHRVNDDFRGPPRRQLIIMILFSFSTLFKSRQEATLSTLGRIVMMVWLFLLMVITSSYTASLTSILTVQQLSSQITGIDSLIASNQRIGYQVGSFAHSYLIESLGIPESRLVSLATPAAYERALLDGPTNGGVAAIVDELPYIELFLSKTGDFGIVGQEFTKSGWGFAFQKGSPLAIDMSIAIIRLSEMGELQKIHDKWFCEEICGTQNTHRSEPNQLNLRSFWGLFLVCGIVSFTAFFMFLLRAICQFVRYNWNPRDPSSTLEISRTGCSHAVYRFFDFIDEKEEAIKKIFKQHENTQPQVI